MPKGPSQTTNGWKVRVWITSVFIIFIET